MNVLYLLIISILLVAYYKLQVSKENFTDNIFSHVVENSHKGSVGKIKSGPMDIRNVTPIPKPEYLPLKVGDYYYCGKLELHPYNEPREVYLYGKPIDGVHNLYSYYVFYIKDKKISDNVSLNPHKKFNLGDPVFVRDGPEKEGPYFLM